MGKTNIVQFAETLKEVEETLKTVCGLLYKKSTEKASILSETINWSNYSLGELKNFELLPEDNSEEKGKWLKFLEKNKEESGNNKESYSDYISRTIEFMNNPFHKEYFRINVEVGYFDEVSIPQKDGFLVSGHTPTLSWDLNSSSILIPYDIFDLNDFELAKWAEDKVNERTSFLLSQLVDFEEYYKTHFKEKEYTKKYLKEKTISIDLNSLRKELLKAGIPPKVVEEVLKNK